MAPVVVAGHEEDENGGDNDGVSVGANRGCGDANVPELGEFWADVHGRLCPRSDVYHKW